MKIQTSFRTAVFGALFLLVFSPAVYAQGKIPTLTVTDGQFQMRATYKFSDQEAPIVDFGGNVKVAVKNKEISIVVPIFNSPIVMKLKDGIFKGKLQNEGANIEFQCEIVGNDHTEGVFFGSLGQRKVTGIWTMKTPKKQANENKGT